MALLVQRLQTSGLLQKWNQISGTVKTHYWYSEIRILIWIHLQGFSAWPSVFLPRHQLHPETAVLASRLSLIVGFPLQPSPSAADPVSKSMSSSAWEFNAAYLLFLCLNDSGEWVDIYKRLCLCQQRKMCLLALLETEIWTCVFLQMQTKTQLGRQRSGFCWQKIRAKLWWRSRRIWREVKGGFLYLEPVLIRLQCYAPVCSAGVTSRYFQLEVCSWSRFFHLLLFALRRGLEQLSEDLRSFSSCSMKEPPRWFLWGQEGTFTAHYGGWWHIRTFL